MEGHNSAAAVKGKWAVKQERSGPGMQRKLSSAGVTQVARDTQSVWLTHIRWYNSKVRLTHVKGKLYKLHCLSCQFTYVRNCNVLLVHTRLKLQNPTLSCSHMCTRLCQAYGYLGTWNIKTNAFVPLHVCWAVSSQVQLSGSILHTCPDHALAQASKVTELQALRA